MPRVLIFVLLMLFGTLGCRSIQRSDLAGTWVMKDASRQELPTELQKTSAKLVLDANGRFTAYDMPGLFYFPNLRPLQLESGSGVWKLEVEEGEPQIQLNFESIANWKQGDLPFSTHLYLSKRWSTIDLYYSLGDPDEGRRIEFERK